MPAPTGAGPAPPAATAAHLHAPGRRGRLRLQRARGAARPAGGGGAAAAGAAGLPPPATLAGAWRSPAHGRRRQSDKPIRPRRRRSRFRRARLSSSALLVVAWTLLSPAPCTLDLLVTRRPAAWPAPPGPWPSAPRPCASRPPRLLGLAAGSSATRARTPSISRWRRPQRTCCSPWSGPAAASSPSRPTCRSSTPARPIASAGWSRSTPSPRWAWAATRCSRCC